MKNNRFGRRRAAEVLGHASSTSRSEEEVRRMLQAVPQAKVGGMHGLAHKG